MTETCGRALATRLTYKRIRQLGQRNQLLNLQPSAIDQLHHLPDRGHRLRIQRWDIGRSTRRVLRESEGCRVRSFRGCSYAGCGREALRQAVNNRGELSSRFVQVSPHGIDYQANGTPIRGRQHITCSDQTA